MSEMEEKLGAILNNPQMMQQIMSMAQAMNSAASSPEPQNSREPPQNSLPPLDPGLLQSLASLSRQSGIDQNQQSLLKALCPYLSRNRVHKLERAMRAAKMAGLASGFLNAGGLNLLMGR